MPELLPSLSEAFRELLAWLSELEWVLEIFVRGSYIDGIPHTNPKGKDAVSKWKDEPLFIRKIHPSGNPNKAAGFWLSDIIFYTLQTKTYTLSITKQSDNYNNSHNPLILLCTNQESINSSYKPTPTFSLYWCAVKYIYFSVSCWLITTFN